MGRFNDFYTGAERELLDLQRLIAGRRPVALWSEAAPHRSYAGRGITTVQPFSHHFPKEGVLLIGGVHVRPGVWLKYTRFERVIVFCNLANHGLLFSLIAGIREATGLEPELVFVSRMLQQSVGLPGRVSHSLMDLQPFRAVAGARHQRPQRLPASPFVVGRVSRDALDKHHPEDPALYRMLAGRGIQLRIMGGTCLAPALDGVEGIELLPAGAEPVADFYASLDAFFYRTGVSVEAYGRVVAEAMACGLPVVAHRRGGYVEIVEEGRSGFLIDTQEQAYDALMRLQASEQLCREVGQAAVHQAQDIHGPQATARALDFYLR
jgi:glycosyltransferase involved in cell wall biosynthesis